MCNIMYFICFTFFLLVIPFPIINHVIPNNYKVPALCELVDLRCSVEFYVNTQQNRSMITCLVPGRILLLRGHFRHFSVQCVV